MKKLPVILFIFVLSLPLNGCVDATPPSPQAQRFMIDEQTFTLAFDDNTLTSGTILSENGQYAFSHTVYNTITLTYPDGFVYQQTTDKYGVTASDDYDSIEAAQKGYISGFFLVTAIEQAADRVAMTSPSHHGSNNFLLAILLIGFGFWNCLAPQSLWWLAHGWRYKNAEPSELALALYRFFGVLLIFIGIICAIAAL